MPILSSSCTSISCQCISVLIILLLLRSSGDSDIPSISIPYIGYYPRNSFGEQVQIVYRVQPGKVESTKSHSDGREKVILLITVAFEDLSAEANLLW